MRFYLFQKAGLDGTAAFWMVVMAACFLSGSVLGTISVCTASDQTGEMLSAAVSSFLRQDTSWELPPWSLLALHLAAPALSFFFGFFVFGGVFCGGVSLAYGYLLSFYSTAFLRLHGLAGLLDTVCFFAIPALILVPVLLLLGARSGVASGALWRLSCGRAGTVTPPLYGREHWLCFGAALLLMILAVLYLIFLAPLLWRSLT